MISLIPMTLSRRTFPGLLRIVLSRGGSPVRYFKMALATTAEKIETNAKVRLRDYSYGSTISAVNSFMLKQMRNGLTFLIYRVEEDETALAGFSFDEKKDRFEEVYSYILGILAETFCIKRVREEPQEITMFEYSENASEAKRHDLAGYSNTFMEMANLWYFDYDYSKTKEHRFDFEEKIVDEHKKRSHFLYDSKFIEELTNIENHKNTTDFCGNMVHYVISGRSIDACIEMTESLVGNLFKANRIKSRRIELITNIEPALHTARRHIERIIENNYGGTIVFDLTEKFGFDTTDYLLVCKYIESLIKKYKNECLFVFTYNMEHTGFSYYLLPKLKRYVIPVMLREGTGDRNSAVKYLKELVKASEYALYAKQTSEFLKQYPGTEFTLTEILEAYEQFESWSINKNVLQAYNYNISDEFMLDRDENTESSYEKLQKMIGLNSVKKQIDDIIATNIVEKERKNRQKKNYQSGTMHMVFAGNPGTAKTTVARLFAGIAKEKEVLKSGVFIEKGGMDLDGLGCNHAIREAFTAAKGGVLFIDEAYSLKSDYAVTVLVQEMENHREDVIVILAGYNERMQEFMEINEGLKSRIPYWIDFPDYDVEELTEIFSMMIKEKGMEVTEDAVKEAYYIFDKKRYQDNFGNGRYVRNLMEHAIQNQSVRLLKQRENVEQIKNKELFLIVKSDIATLEEGLLEEREPGTAKKEFDEMIGLSKAKDVIGKALANFKLKKLCMDKGIARDKASLHMVFTGNPGTAKTTVARLFAEIMKDEKVLPTGKFVEVGRADLVGNVVGATAPLVKRKFREARGGVLFIDEAYSLCDGYEGGYGDEAINTIVQEMENHRDNVIVIFAGYPVQMKQFLDRNPGLLSRIAFQVEFEDYTLGELCEITKLMLSRKEMSITNAAMDKLKAHFENVIGSNDYGNGRFVRKILEEAEMNLAKRVLRLEEEEITKEIITTIEEADIPEKAKKDDKHKRTIGFAV